MAQILDINAPQVNPAGAPPNDYLRINANPAMFGALTGQALEKVGGAVEKGASSLVDIAEFQDRINVDDQVNKWMSRKDQILNGDPNKTVTGPDGQPQPDRGYMGLTGRAASDARAGTLAALEQARVEGRNNLSSPMARLAYDQQTRRMFSVADNDIGQHSRTQWTNWAGGVNNTGAAHELNAFVNSLDNPEEAAGHIHNYINFRVQQAQLTFGNDPKINAEAEAKAKQELLQAQVDAVAVKDPKRADEILDSNRQTAGTLYDDMKAKLRARATDANARDAANRAIAMATGIGGRTYARNDVATTASAAWRNAGASPSAVAGVMFNINEESSFNPSLRHPDQPRFDPSDERHYAHGLYQEGAEEWTRYEGWLKANHAGADWRDPQLQSEFAAWNLKTNYPDTWARMNAAKTPEEAAAIYAREYLRPAAANLQSRLTKIGQGVGAPNSYSGTVTSPPPGQGGFTPVADVGATTSTPLGGAPDATAPPDRRLQLSNALNNLEADPNISEQERERGRLIINREFQTLDVIDNQTARAKKDANDTAASGYVTELADALHPPPGKPPPDLVALSGRVAHDPNLNWETRGHLLDRIAKYSGEEQRIGYGPGFFDAKSRVLSPPGTPGHIGSIDDILGLPDNAVTMQGQHELVGIFNASKREDQGALQQAKIGVENAAKLRMVRPDATGGFMVDRKGEQLFNGRFLPMFNSAYNEWVKAGKNPYDFLLDQKKIDALVEQTYPKNDRDRDAINATSIPAPPPGIKAENWMPVIGNPPMLVTGKPATYEQWSKALTRLYSDPSPRVMADFDAYMEPSGIKAIDVLRRLDPAAAAKIENTGPETAPPSATAEKQPSIMHWLMTRDPKDPGNPLAPIGRFLNGPERLPDLTIPRELTRDFDRRKEIDSELSSLSDREDSLKKSKLGGAFFDAQMKRINDQRAALSAEREKLSPK